MLEATILHLILLPLNSFAFYFFLSARPKSEGEKVVVSVWRVIIPIALLGNFSKIFSDPYIQELLKKWDL
jgi:hypothetical protein